jgi:hypothetical protein
VSLEVSVFLVARSQIDIERLVSSSQIRFRLGRYSSKSRLGDIHKYLECRQLVPYLYRLLLLLD